MSHPPPLAVLLPEGQPKCKWASQELLTRLGMPWRPWTSGLAPSALTVAVGTPLPKQAHGVEILPGKDGQDAIRLAGELADDSVRADLFEQHAGGQIHIKIDLPDAYEAWLARREEVCGADFDDVGRAEHDSSALARAAGDASAVAEKLAELVYSALDKVARATGQPLPPRSRAWPDGKKFAVHLSHDMDIIGGRYQLWRRYAGWSARWLVNRIAGKRALAEKDLAKLRRYWSCQEDPQYTTPTMLDIEARYGATSSCYFFCSKTRRIRGRRAIRMYRITDPLARQVIELVRQAGSEPGVHGFPDDSQSASGLARSKALLESVTGEPCVGVRQHYLCMKVPETWQAQSEAGFKYDATLGWHRNAGMRAGTCVPFVTWDIRAGRSLGIYEIPLTAMDVANKIQWPDPDTWLEKLRPFVDAAQSHGGVVSLLLHPHHFDDVDFPGQTRFYEEFLKEMSRRAGWLTSGENIWRAMTSFRASLET